MKTLDTPVRSARPDDLPQLVEIYNHYVLHSPATFDLETFDTQSRRAWFDGFATSGPIRLVVAAEGKRIVGYASSSRLRSKPAYDRSVETTIYLHPDRTGGGLGRHLYAGLIKCLEGCGIHRLYAAIVLPNPASVRLHTHFGFRPVGRFGEVGFKFDRYWDIEWYERPMS